VKEDNFMALFFNICRSILMVCVSIGFSGCATTDYKKQPNTTLSNDAYLRMESQRYKDPNKPPALCLALSGGGIRAAAFSMGVLSSLERTGILKEEIDLVSSVSGGGYALSSVLAHEQKWREGNTESDAVTDLAWATIKHNHDFVTPVKAIYNVGFSFSAFLLNTLAEQSIKNVSDGITFIPDAGNIPYTRNIRQTFSGGYKSVEMKDLKQRLSFDPTSLPYPILIASARDDVEKSCLDRSNPGSFGNSENLASRIFEFTPLGFGAEGRGYWTQDVSNLDLFRAAALSAAAPDHPISPFCNLLKGTKASVGGVLELPSSGISKERRLFISDGGHAENLGLYPLIRRKCRRILVVDSAHDPWLIADAYQRLKAILKLAEIDLIVDKLESLYAGRYDQCSAEEMCFVEPKKEAETIGRRTDESVFSGYVAWPHNSEGRRQSLITYVKLAYDEKKAAQGDYGDEVKKCTPDNKYDCSGSEDEDYFPHYPTTDQSLNDAQLDALYALGRHRGRQLVEVLKGTNDDL